MSVRIQLRRDTAANWTASNPTLTQGEPGYETDTGKIKYGDGSTAWTSLAYASGGLPTAFAAGTAAAPGFAVDGDSNTGIYSPGADQLALSTGGSHRLRITAEGNVGVGTTTPDNFTNYTTLDVRGATGGILQTSNGAQKARLYVTGGGCFLGAVSNDPLIFNTNDTERLRITAAGLVGIGTSSVQAPLHVLGAATVSSVGDVSAKLGRTGDSAVLIGSTDGNKPFIASEGAYPLYLRTNNQNALVIDSSQRVGIGTTTVNAPLEVRKDGAGEVLVSRFSNYNAGEHYLNIYVNDDSNAVVYQSTGSSGGAHVWRTGNTESVRIDTNARLLVGTSSSATVGIAQYSKVQVKGNTFSSNEWGSLALMRDSAATTGLTAGTYLGGITFADSVGAEFASIISAVDAATGSNDYPGRLVFSTTADGASSPTERFRITSAGDLLFGTTSTAPNNSSTETGIVLNRSFSGNGFLGISRGSEGGLAVNRTIDDGTLVYLQQAGTVEGTISVSGTTVSYNGAHLSRWSQLPSGAERTEILRGTVLSNIDEMCEWGEEENEQLNRMKVSDVEGDKNVSGVFQAWDDDDDTYTNDFYCAMTGDFIIRIGAGITVERGDLLMSAGDGTAKPQNDDIIRSKTIAKVTSTNVSCTYEDGSYCVPCVLMAC